MWTEVNPALRRILATAVAVSLALTAAGKNTLHTPGEKSPDLPPDAGRDALRQIVQNQCVVNWRQQHDPAPCERLYLADANSDEAGYAVLADRKGGAHYLLIPVPTMTGIDASDLLDPDTPNYFADAWRARDVITKFVGHPVPRTAIGLAVNKAQSRSQNQFHIHMECLRQDVADQLRAVADQLTDKWMPVAVGGSPYDAMRLAGDNLNGANPYELVAKLKPGVSDHIGDYTVIIAGMQYTSGPGFVLITGTGQSGELLLDSSCSVAGGGG
jgi:CDP-diacylglycerol pyrophosphatase